VVSPSSRSLHAELEDSTTGWATPSRLNTCAGCLPNLTPHPFGDVPRRNALRTCTLVFAGAFEFFSLDGEHPVLEEPAGHSGPQPGSHGDSSLVIRSHGKGLVLVVVQESPALILVELFVDLHVLAPGKSHDTSTLITVERNLTILALQRQAGSLRDDEGQNRSHNEQDLESVDDTFNGQLEVGSNEVGARRSPEDGVEDHTDRANCGASGRIPGTVSDVVLTLVARDPGLKEGVQGNRSNEHNENHGGHKDVHRPGKAEEDKFPPRWNQSQSSVCEADVPVGLCTSRHGGWVVRTVVPNRVDGEERGNKNDQAKDQEEESTCFGSKHWHDG